MAVDGGPPLDPRRPRSRRDARRVREQRPDRRRHEHASRPHGAGGPIARDRARDGEQGAGPGARRPRVRRSSTASRGAAASRRTASACAIRRCPTTSRSSPAPRRASPTTARDCTADGPNLADQLEAAHRTWDAYLEGLPAPVRAPGLGRTVREEARPVRLRPRRSPRAPRAADGAYRSIASRPTCRPTGSRLRLHHARPVQRHPRLLGRTGDRFLARARPGADARARTARVPRRDL